MRVFESFRDPQGKVLLTDNAVWRLVNSAENFRLKEFLDLKLAKQLELSDKIIQTTCANENEITFFAEEFNESAPISPDFSLYKHRRIEFPSFPYEWAPEMLYDAGNATLEIAEKFLTQGAWSIKDASPFNILFQGTKPIFIDILSFEKRDEKDPIWLPFNQFVQTFLLPLLVNKETGLSLQTIFLADRNGLSVSEAAKFFGRIKKLKPGILSLVTVPNLLSKRAESDTELYKPKTLNSAEKAQFILNRSFSRLRKQLEKVSPNRFQQSNWTEYTKHNQEVVPEYMRAKQEFVTRTINEIKPKNVLDVGCNTGFFSFIAARAGANVVAIDYDEAVIGEVYQTAKKENLNVLPLIVNLSRPTPRLGWRYSENPSFLDRAIGRFDLVMMLAVIHHMLVQERIPLREIMRLAADLTKDALIIEFVPTSDILFKRLARGREHLHQDLTSENFRNTAKEFFSVIDSIELPQTDRQLFLMRKNEKIF